MKNHANIEIREARPTDAKQLNAYVHETFKTSDHLITRPDEFRMGVWRQRHWISKKQINPLETCLLATADNHIIGMLDNWTDRRARVTHSTCFAMTVKEGWRCQGIGTTILKQFIAWVKKHPTLERIELHVHNDNTHAINLYEAMGFQHEGTRRNAVKYEDGRVVDDHLMALWP